MSQGFCLCQQTSVALQNTYSKQWSTKKSTKGGYLQHLNAIIQDVNYANDPVKNGGSNPMECHNHDLNNDHCKHSYLCYCGCYFESLRGLNSHR